MTSQIVVLNRAGVAVASDSVGTIVDGDGEYVSTIINSRKVFELGGKHNILILNSDNLDINGVPVDALLASWRSYLGRQRLKTTWDYIENFLDWLESCSNDFFPEMAATCTGFFDNSLRGISEAVAAKFEGLRPFQDATVERASQEPEFASRYRRAVALEVSGFLKYLDSLPMMRFADDELPVSEVNRRAKKTFEFAAMEDRVTVWFPYQVIAEKTLKKLSAGLCNALNKIPIDRAASLARLTFVGYGKEDMFPTCWELGIEGKYDSVVRWRGLSSSNVSEGLPVQGSKAQIQLFAQASFVEAFLTGIHPQFIARLKSEVPAALVEDWDANLEPGTVTDDERGVWHGIGVGVFQKLEPRIAAFRDYQLSEFLGSVSGMGTIELDRLARSLLSMEMLATLKVRGPATVGGRTVSATINLEDGITWTGTLNGDS